MGKMDAAIYQFITDDADISNDVGNRVTPIVRTQGSAVPAIAYRKVFANRTYDNDGRAVIEQSFDLHVYAKKYSQLQTIIENIENNLTGKSGSFGGLDVEYCRTELVGNDDYLASEELYTDTIELKLRFRGFE